MFLPVSRFFNVCGKTHFQTVRAQRAQPVKMPGYFFGDQCNVPT
ncbi:hypothetical protein SAMN05216264_10382 [Pseudomonas marincola]|nr:hypothetical protein SAMN05216264_10382 [Pseudomonas marincola]